MANELTVAHVTNHFLIPTILKKSHGYSNFENWSRCEHWRLRSWNLGEISSKETVLSQGKKKKMPKFLIFKCFKIKTFYYECAKDNV